MLYTSKSQSSEPNVITWGVSCWYDVSDLIKPTALFNGEIADTVVLKGTEKKEMQIVADPEGATVTAESDTVGVATASYASGKLTVDEDGLDINLESVEEDITKVNEHISFLKEEITNIYNKYISKYSKR